MSCRPPPAVLLPGHFLIGSEGDKRFFGLTVFSAVFQGRHIICLPEYPGEMVGRIVTNSLCDLADLKIRIGQIIDRFRHPQTLYEPGKIVPGVLFDQSTKVRLAVMEQLCQ